MYLGLLKLTVYYIFSLYLQHQENVEQPSLAGLKLKDYEVGQRLGESSSNSAVYSAKYKGDEVLYNHDLRCFLHICQIQCSRDAMLAEGFTQADHCLIVHNGSIWYQLHFVTIFYCCTFSSNYITNEKFNQVMTPTKLRYKYNVMLFKLFFVCTIMITN